MLECGGTLWWNLLAGVCVCRLLAIGCLARVCVEVCVELGRSLELGNEGGVEGIGFGCVGNMQVLF
ncbi:hypothetical protein M758_10G165500 [Ceratodon purpureus]|nr:hypothetical protein M758_10G165500 [Ceratodon purpureus]